MKRLGGGSIDSFSTCTIVSSSVSDFRLFGWSNIVGIPTQSVGKKTSVFTSVKPLIPMEV